MEGAQRWYGNKLSFHFAADTVLSSTVKGSRFAILVTPHNSIFIFDPISLSVNLLFFFSIYSTSPLHHNCSSPFHFIPTLQNIYLCTKMAKNPMRVLVTGAAGTFFFYYYFFPYIILVFVIKSSWQRLGGFFSLEWEDVCVHFHGL